MPGLSFSGVLILLALLLMHHLFRPGAHSGLKLVKRARWLFLLILLGYAYGLPGESAWPTLNAYSPSQPGLKAGLQQGGALLALLLLLDMLVLRLSEHQLLAGLHGLFTQTRLFGMAAERITVRLALTLRAMQGGDEPIRGGKTNILSCLLNQEFPLFPSEKNQASSDICDTLQLTLTPWNWTDRIAILLGAMLLGSLWFWKVACA